MFHGRFLLAGICAAMLAQRAVGAVSWPSIGLTSPIPGLSLPVFITSARDGSGRLFVVLQGGTIQLIKNGTVQSTPFLSISDRVSCCGERGLLSVAFPPDYTSKGYFYVYYTDTSGNLAIARYFLTGNPDIADATSEVILLTIPHPTFANHNGGQLAFGPNDGYLYIGTGDGGGAGDTSNNAQNTNVLLGKILRIDVESGAVPYAIPASNPTITPTPSRHEIWALGVRNPWRFSFDRATADLYIGDVGQASYEEIDYQTASSIGGENYGWHIMEGFHCYNASVCDSTGLTLPIFEYPHTAGNCSITGGYVYRGAQSSRMAGIYFYADYCTGQIWGLQRDGSTWVNSPLLDAPFNITSFGEDEAGELYVADYTNGAINRIVDTAPTATATPTPTATPIPTSTPTFVQVDLGTGVGLPGGAACVAATLKTNNHTVAGASTDLGFDANQFSMAGCTIAAAIGAGTAADKQLTQTTLGPGQERIAITGVDGNTNPISDGPLYTCVFNLGAGITPGSYAVSNTVQATAPDGSSLPAAGASGALVVTTCNGDCDGNGTVVIGEVVRVVNQFLGQPYCGCPVADTNHDGIVSIGEVVQSVNRFLSGCQ